MLIALFPSLHKKESQELAREICPVLQKKGVRVVTETNFCSSLKTEALGDVPPEAIEFIITLGGDGTILQILHHYPFLLHAPVLGINMGSLGFMADIPLSEVFFSLDHLLQKRFYIQRRIILEGKAPHEQPFFAINDVVVHRAINPSLIDLAIYVDGHYLNTFSADGVIVSTPNGSTAYSLAAGGPILSPCLDCIVITPICPHTMSNRPIVLRPEKELRIEYLSDKKPVELSYDGIAHHNLSMHQSCILYPSKRHFSLAILDERDEFSTLRTKLGWSGKLRGN